MANHSQFQLLRERRFAPFFWTQFLGAGNDNVYKNALVIFVAFQAMTLTALSANDLVNIAAAVFIAPFVLFSATAGQIADKFEKSRLIRLIKLFEIGIMIVGAIGFYRRDLILLFAALTLMGVHSTLFGPVKYAILPQNLRNDELIGGNGLVEMGTFVAILLGEIVGGVVIAVKPEGPMLAGVTTIAIAVAGYLVSRRIPPAPAVAPELRINWNPFTETSRNLRFAYGNRVVWLSMLGISWFWFYGATYLTQFATFTKGVLGGDEHVATLLLALFSVGIGIGSLLCERLSGHKVEVGLVPFGSIGLSVFAIDLYFASRGLQPQGLAGIEHFISVGAHWRIVVDLVLLGAFGGFYIVPLYALIQERSDPAYRSRIIAANNILNALFMVASAGIALGLLKAGLTIPQLFLATGLMNAIVAIYIYSLVPEFLMRFLAWLLIHSLYRVDKQGLEQIPDQGACVIICNHVSFVDAIVIAACVNRPVRFVMDHRIYGLPLLHFIFRTMRAIPIASGKEDAALKERAFVEAADALKAGEIVCIFPEGKITDTGEINPFRPGLQRILAQAPVPVVPMALRGLWGSFFSRSYRGKAMRRLRGLFSRIALGRGRATGPRPGYAGTAAGTGACLAGRLPLGSEEVPMPWLGFFLGSLIGAYADGVRGLVHWRRDRRGGRAAADAPALVCAHSGAGTAFGGARGRSRSVGAGAARGACHPLRIGGRPFPQRAGARRGPAGREHARGAARAAFSGAQRGRGRGRCQRRHRRPGDRAPWPRYADGERGEAIPVVIVHRRQHAGARRRGRAFFRRRLPAVVFRRACERPHRATVCRRRAGWRGPDRCRRVAAQRPTSLRAGVDRRRTGRAVPDHIRGTGAGAAALPRAGLRGARGDRCAGDHSGAGV